MIYLDTSVLLAAVLDEPNSEAARGLLSRHDELSGSDWLMTEVASALGIKDRTGRLAPGGRQRALAACRAVLANSVTMLEVTGATCRAATALIECSSLRGGDALHLAVAKAHGAVVWTLDQGMAEAGQALGLDTRLLT